MSTLRVGNKLMSNAVDRRRCRDKHAANGMWRGSVSMNKVDDLYGHWRVGSECNAQCGLRYTERTQDTETQDKQNANQQAPHSGNNTIKSKGTALPSTPKRHKSNSKTKHTRKEAAHTVAPAKSMLSNGPMATSSFHRLHGGETEEREGRT